MDASALASAESWLSMIAMAKLAATALVALGVAIEFGTDWIARPYEKVVKNARELEIIGLQTEARRLSAEADVAKSEIARANADATQARLEQERLRAQLAWRRLTPEQHILLVAALREVHLDAPLPVSYPIGDAEAATLADEIVRCLKEAHIPIAGDGASASVWMPTPPLGIIVRQPGAEQIVQPLARELGNVRFVPTINVEVGGATLTLIIGSKPPSF